MDGGAEITIRTRGNRSIEMKTEEIIALLWEAFSLGWSYGQGEMEQSMDDNLFDAFLQSSASDSIGGGSAPCHTVALPKTFDVNDKNEAVNVRPDYENKYVRYKLHSDEWREKMLSKKYDFMKILVEVSSKTNDINQRHQRHQHLLTKIGRAHRCPAMDREIKCNSDYQKFLRITRINK